MSSAGKPTKLSRATLFLYFELRDELRDLDEGLLGGKFGVLNKALEELREAVYEDVEGQPHESDESAMERIEITFDYWDEIYDMLYRNYLPVADSLTEADIECVFSDGVLGNDVDGAREHLCEVVAGRVGNDE